MKNEQALSAVKEITVVPSQDIQDARYYRYRDEEGYIRECVVLYINNNKYVLYRRQISQLFRYLPAKISSIRNIYTPEQRDAALKQALERCDNELVLSIVKNRVIRVVSSDFVGVPHKTLLKMIEQRLAGRYEKREISYEYGMFAQWTLKSVPKSAAEVGHLVSWKIWCYNRCDGSHSLRIGAGFEVLKCKNGAVAFKNAHRVTIIHRGDEKTVMQKLAIAIDDLWNKQLTLIANMIQRAYNLIPDKSKYYRLINKYPQWIQRELHKQLKTAQTVWDISNAFSYVATHEPVTFNQRLQLSNDAVEVLRLAKVRQ